VPATSCGPVSRSIEQGAILTQDLSELVLVVGLVLAWNTRRIGALPTPALRRRVLLTVLAFVPTYGLARIIQHLNGNPRPINVVPLQPLADAKTWAGLQHGFTGSGSFPSDHAALSAIIAVMAFSIGRRYGWFFTIFGLYESLYRVAFGFHWPSDIVGGMLIGTCVATVALLSRPYLRPPLTRVLALLRRYPAIGGAVTIAFLVDFGNGFLRLQTVTHILVHGNLFH